MKKMNVFVILFLLIFMFPLFFNPVFAQRLTQEELEILKGAGQTNSIEIINGNLFYLDNETGEIVLILTLEDQEDQAGLTSKDITVIIIIALITVSTMIFILVLFLKKEEK